MTKGAQSVRAIKPIVNSFFSSSAINALVTIDRPKPTFNTCFTNGTFIISSPHSYGLSIHQRDYLWSKLWLLFNQYISIIYTYNLSHANQKRSVQLEKIDFLSLKKKVSQG
jgi:hypothetical protein